MVEVQDAYYGYKINQQVNDRVAWETARFVSFVTLKGAGNKKIKTPTDLMKFDWENDTAKKGTKGNKWTKEEIQELKKKRPDWFK